MSSTHMPAEAAQSTHVGFTTVWTRDRFCFRFRFPGMGPRHTHTGA